MMYLPPKQNRKKNSPRRTLHDRYNTTGVRSGMSGIVRSSLSTSQGMSTLKIVIMYSILGMVLHWLLPTVILKMNPDMLKEEAQYFGTLGAIVITVFFLIVSLLKGLILRSRSQSKQSKTQGTDTQLFGPKNSKNKEKLNGG